MGKEKEPLPRMAPESLFILLAAYSQPVLVFLSCGQTAPDMALGFIDVKYDNVLQTLRYVFMNRRFANPKPLRRLPNRCIVVYYVIGDGHCPLFDIILHGLTLENVFYILCRHNFHYESYSDSFISKKHPLMEPSFP